MEPMSELFNIRAYALEQAVKLYAGAPLSPTNDEMRNREIIKAAHAFESYLSERPADQQAATQPCIGEKVGA